MPNHPNSSSDDEALDWALRMAEPDADWAAFTTWLETAPDHARRYDRAVLALEDTASIVAMVPVAVPTAANDDDIATRAVHRSQRGWLGMALAASIVGAIGIGLWTERNQSYVIATVAGEQRTVALADGSSIELSGGSSIVLDRAAPRVARLQTGDALFRVHHDADHPFRVDAGGLALSDLGTVFDVRMSGSRVRVAVAEGAVMVDPEGAAVRIDPGQAIVAEGDRLRRETTDVSEVGAWSRGRLAYAGALLEDVAADLSRHLGVRIAVAPAVRKRRFYGTLEIGPLRRDPAMIGALLDVTARRTTDGWRLEARR
ncbi:MAG: FecR domain-containing protein [Sphingomonas paucimobilis]